MELWVRSQNKTILSKVHDLVIREDRNENNEINYFIIDTYTLGIYKTKEKALKVLNEIESILKPIIKTNTYKVEQAELLDGTKFIKPILDDIEIENTLSYVYQMPEDE